MALGSLVWDESATMIDVHLENAINMHSVWTAWFQFWGKQFSVILWMCRLKKSIKMQRHLIIAFCVPSCLLDTWMWIFILNVTNEFDFSFYSPTLHYKFRYVHVFYFIIHQGKLIAKKSNTFTHKGTRFKVNCYLSKSAQPAPLERYQLILNLVKTNVKRLHTVPEKRYKSCHWDPFKSTNM